MGAQSVTVDLPSPLYERLVERAQQTHRSLEDELLDVVATAVPPDEGLPPDLAAAIASLSLLDDDALWHAARSHLPADAAAKIEALHEKRQLTSLTVGEQDLLDTLLSQYERFMLIRARAAALLYERGHDVSRLIATQ